jgi:hypothetical protein
MKRPKRGSMDEENTYRHAVFTIDLAQAICIDVAGLWAPQVQKTRFGLDLCRQIYYGGPQS